jgi:16S rRNA (cytidine1402-2'-O)-methyltransferase
MTLNANSTTGKHSGKLYVVAIPIGNAGDITTRAIETLAKVDTILCEERKNGSRLLKSLGIEKPLLELNEHNEAERIQEVLLMLAQGQSLALISDCGTPVFSDPGKKLLQLLYEMNIKVTPIPGASSLMAAHPSAHLTWKNSSLSVFYPSKLTSVRRSFSIEACRLSLVLIDTPLPNAKIASGSSTDFRLKSKIFS